MLLGKLFLVFCFFPLAGERLDLYGIVGSGLTYDIGSPRVVCVEEPVVGRKPAKNGGCCILLGKFFLVFFLVFCLVFCLVPLASERLELYGFVGSGATFVFLSLLCVFVEELNAWDTPVKFGVFLLVLFVVTVVLPAGNLPVVGHTF